MNTRHNFTKVFGTTFVLGILLALCCVLCSATNNFSCSAKNKQSGKSTTIYVEAEEYSDFTGNEIEPEAKLYVLENGNKVYLNEGSDYNLSKSGTALLPGSSANVVVTLTESCRYSLTESCSFLYYVNSADSSKLTISSIPDQTYTGAEIQPVPEIRYDGNIMDSRCYTLEYGFNTETDDYNYTGISFDESLGFFDESKYFNIIPASASKVSVKISGNTQYTSYAITPELEVTLNGNHIYTDQYTVKYSNNIKVGTATVKLTFNGENIKGTKTVNFTISKGNAANFDVSTIYDKDYTGSAIKPEPYVYNFSYVVLEKGKDYTLSYSNNIKPGTATITIKGIGNYTGTKKVSFKICVEKPYYIYFSVSSDEKLVLQWYKTTSSGYVLEKYDSTQKKYVVLKSTKSTSYTDANIKELSTYKYRLKTKLTIDGKNYYSEYCYGSYKTPYFAPKNVKLTVKSDGNTIKWSKKSGADKYIVYRTDVDNGSTKALKTTTSTSYKDTTAKTLYDYDYYVVACKKGTTTKSANSEKVCTINANSICNGLTLKSKTSYKVYNIQGSKTTLKKTVTLSSADIKTLKAFAGKHFTSDMTPQKKVEVTLYWIHSQVTYASSSANYSKISGKSYVDAIFNYKLGQCAQYNGALAGMMTYLGFDVQLLQGYRNGSYQHFWVEAKVNGLTYVMEAGNKKDGNWWYFFRPYRYTRGYYKNGKAISGGVYRSVYYPTI